MKNLDNNQAAHLTVKKALPRGGIKRIVEKTGLSKQSVTAVLGGKWKNEKVILAALEVIKEHKKVSSTISKKINELLS